HLRNQPQCACHHVKKCSDETSVALIGSAVILPMPNELNPLSDSIHIEQLEIFTHIGVPEKERATPQRLTVSITLWPKQDTRDLGDQIGRTVNYSAVAEEAKSFARD